MRSTLNILQADLWKSTGVQDSLYNDPEEWEFDIILIQEPHCFDGNIHITGVGPNFEAIKAKDIHGRAQDARIRSCIWANKNNEYTRVPTSSNDITMLMLKKAERSILVASVYIPNSRNRREEDDRKLSRRLQEVQKVIDDEKTANAGLEVFISGDFNRYDSLWGGDRVAVGSRQGEGDKILDFMEGNDLQLLTPRGMVT